MKNINIPIITLGVSKNSWDALRLYFKQIESVTGYAYVIMQESEADLDQSLKELSDIKFQLPVQIIEDGMVVESNRIYINPPRKSFVITSNKFKLKKQVQEEKLGKLLSAFFESLADEKKEGSAVILLSESEYVEKIKGTVEKPIKKLFFENEFYKLSSIANQTKNSVIITDIEGRITYVNQSFLNLTGYEEDFVAGKKPGDFLQGKDTNPKTVEIMSKALAKLEGFEVDVVNYSKNGRKYWTNINCEPLLDKNDRIKGFFSIQYEISHQKEYEEQIQTLNELLKSRNNKLTELNKSLEEFAYVASHDLKEPARNIKSILELILKKSKGELNEKLENYMRMAAGAGDKMNQMINSLLEYSRSGVLNEELKTVNLRDMTEEVKFSLQKLIKENNAFISVNDHIGDFKAYPILFGRLLQNLIQNAIKYRSEKKPEIMIKASEDEFYYIFSVADNGIGISQRDFDRVFKIFQKVHQNDNDSHGIGLAICKKIVETHLGEITVESQEGYGTTIHFSISKKLDS